FVLAGSLFCAFAFRQKSDSVEKTNTVQEEGIHWHTFKEALELSKKEKRKVFMDVYTSWCGWCKVMEKNTFSDPIIAKYVNEHFYAVKLDAEMKDTVVFNNYAFVNPNPAVQRSTHQLAAFFLSNKMSYPTTVYLDENFNLLTQVPGYMQPAQLEPILKYFGDNAYVNMKWDEYQKNFKGEINSQPPPVTPPVTH
ncbi:MAG TPA: DUF255 domain-containing protein, partial [Bacteroidia bacterium]